MPLGCSDTEMLISLKWMPTNGPSLTVLFSSGALRGPMDTVEVSVGLSRDACMVTILYARQSQAAVG